MHLSLCTRRLYVVTPGTQSGIVIDYVDPFVRVALAAQLEARQAAVLRGARRVGWKLGTGDAQSMGTGPVVGHLTSDTELQTDEAFDGSDVAALHADVELAVELTRHLDAGEDPANAIGGYCVALELVDLASADTAPDAIVAANIFHRAVAFGPFHEKPPPDGATASLTINERTHECPRVNDIDELLRSTAELLSFVDEALLPGDRIITGAIVQEPVASGDTVIARLGPLGTVTLRIE